MSTPTFRWLDDPPKLLGLEPQQWVWLILGGGSLAAILHFTGVPWRVATTLLIFVVGVPTALAMLGENVGPGINALLADAVRWRRHPHRYDPSAVAARGIGIVVIADNAPTPSRWRRRRARPAAPSTGDAL